MYIIIGIILVVVVIVWIAYEMLMAPTYPDDYDVKDIYKQTESFPQSKTDGVVHKPRRKHNKNGR